MRRHRTNRLLRGGALALASAIALTSGALAVTPAAAATTSIGTLTFSPATGDAVTPILVSTVSAGSNTGCPTGTTNARALVNGPSGWTNIPVISNTNSGVSTTSDFSLPMTDTFAGIAQSNGLTITVGKYDISLICQNRLGTQTFGTFDSSIWFTGPNAYQSNDPNQVATATTTAVTASPASPSTSGTSVTFTATVSPSNAGGTIQFKDGAATLGTPQAVSGGVATFTTNTLSVGSHAISADFAPTNLSAFKASSAPASTYVVSTASATPTTTSLGVSPASPAMAGVPLTFTASVSPAAAGTVQFRDGSTSLGGAVAVANGQAMLTTSSLAVGSHSITATFTPTNPAAFNGSASAALPFTITPGPAQSTSTTLSASPTSPATAGTLVTFTATVSPAAPGTVQFLDGTTAIGTPVAVSGGHASAGTSSLTAGTHSITAAFTPTDPAAFLASTSSASAYIITAGAAVTTTSLSANPASPAAAGTAVTFTASVAPAAPGTVQFLDGTTAIGAAQPLSGGQASTSTSTLTAGTHSVTAVFTPTDPTAFSGSTSAAIPYVISGATGSNLGTLTALPAIGDDATPILLGTHSTGATPGCPVGSNNVRGVINGPGLWSNIPGVTNSSSGVSNTSDFTVPMTDTFIGISQTNNVPIVAGKYDITLFCQNRLGTQVFGSFVGSLWFTDSTHYQSTDPANTVTTTTTQLATSPADRQDLGQPVNLNAAVTPSQAVGTVQFTDTVGGVTSPLGGPVTAVNGIATYTTSSLPFGLHVFAATFVPTDVKTFSPSTSSDVVFVVALPAPPRIIKAAQVVGRGHIGDIMSCSATLTGGLRYTFNWFRNGRVIHYQHLSTYRLTLADRFGFLSCQEIARNLGGSTTSSSRPVFVGLLTYRLLVPPLIFGHHQAGSWLIAFPGDWYPGPMFYAYQWQRDGRTIRGANRQIYRVSAADMGHRISVEVTVSGWFVYSAVAVSRSI